MAEACKFVGCFPSELYARHNPTPADFNFVAAYYKITEEEEAEKFKAMANVLSRAFR